MVGSDSGLGRLLVNTIKILPWTCNAERELPIRRFQIGADWKASQTPPCGEDSKLSRYDPSFLFFEKKKFKNVLCCSFFYDYHLFLYTQGVTQVLEKLWQLMSGSPCTCRKLGYQKFTKQKSVGLCSHAWKSGKIFYFQKVLMAQMSACLQKKKKSLVDFETK